MTGVRGPGPGGPAARGGVGCDSECDSHTGSRWRDLHRDVRSVSRVCVFQREPWPPCAEWGRQVGSQHHRTKGTGPGWGWECREKEATFVDFPTQRLQGWRKRMRTEQPAPSPGSRRGGREPRHPAGRLGLGRECGVTETHEMTREAGWKESRGGPGLSICGGCPEVKPGRVPDSIPQLRSF